MHTERGFSHPMKYLPLFAERSDAMEGHPHANNYFLFVGRLEPFKGAQNLIRAWDGIPDIDLLIAGTGSEARHLREQAAHNPWIKFLGAVRRGELGRYYKHAKGYVAPSLTFETFGLTLIEAFTQETPVIVHDIGALPEIVTESGGGKMYRSEDRLVDAFSRTTANPALREKLGESGYQAFLKLWSREAHLKLYSDVLEQTAQTKFGCVRWSGS
jgi:glycosyltransferase involved in cell wall biosynthesis